MEIQISECGVNPANGELSFKVEVQGQADDLEKKLPEEILNLILSKMCCQSWSELDGKIKSWLEKG